ncbi:hypothetical protein C5C24_02975 [Rathayibacter sp. AY2B3]|nr:hypothetical protein C5C24_02975 [Rathayibacter sp. AY2B3]PPI26523.1 hypothetical protein C5D44_07260 [Rathayibacter sp. AY1B5]
MGVIRWEATGLGSTGSRSADHLGGARIGTAMNGLLPARTAATGGVAPRSRTTAPGLRSSAPF